MHPGSRHLKGATVAQPKQEKVKYFHPKSTNSMFFFSHFYWLFYMYKYATMQTTNKDKNQRHTKMQAAQTEAFRQIFLPSISLQ